MAVKREENIELFYGECVFKNHMCPMVTKLTELVHQADLTEEQKESCVKAHATFNNRTVKISKGGISISLKSYGTVYAICRHKSMSASII